MIDIKNRSRNVLTYQYGREVSAGPVRPQVLNVHRGRHNPATGETTQSPQQITVGGVLTIPAKSELKNLPDVLLDHPALQRDIASRAVSVKQTPNKPPAPKHSPQPVAGPASTSFTPTASSEKKRGKGGK